MGDVCFSFVVMIVLLLSLDEDEHDNIFDGGGDVRDGNVGDVSGRGDGEDGNVGDVSGGGDGDGKHLC